MANKKISELTAVASVAATTEMEVQVSGETTTKKATVTQVLAVESTPRAAQDDAIEAGVGLNTDGTYVTLANSWFLRAADFVAGMTDRSGIVANVTQSIANALRLLDAKLYALSQSIIAVYWTRDGDLEILSPMNANDEVQAATCAFGGVAEDDYVSINKSGAILMHGKGQYVSCIAHPVAMFEAARISTWVGGLKVLTFDPDADESYYFTIVVPESYKEGADLVPIVKWIPMSSAASATRVRWGLEYTWCEKGVTKAASETIIYVATLDPNENPIGYRLYESTFAALSGTNHTKGSLLNCRLFRDANDLSDTLLGDAGVLSIDFYHLNDSVGSYV